MSCITTAVINKKIITMFRLIQVRGSAVLWSVINMHSGSFLRLLSRSHPFLAPPSLSRLAQKSSRTQLLILLGTRPTAPSLSPLSVGPAFQLIYNALYMSRGHFPLKRKCIVLLCRWNSQFVCFILAQHMHSTAFLWSVVFRGRCPNQLGILTMFLFP